MTDLRKAAEMALEALEKLRFANAPFLDEAIKALRQALAQTEPTVEDNSQQWKGMDGAVAWHLIDRHADNWADVGKMMDEWLKANQALSQPQTRVGEMEWHWGYERGWDAAMNQKREWVGLTDEEFEEAVEGLEDLRDCWTQIEAKLKEKNT